MVDPVSVPMLEVHLPHEPLNSWKSFFIHIATVSIGLLIPVGIEQAATFTEHLKADLREEDWGYQLLIAYNREVLVNAEQAVNSLERKTTLSDEAFLISTYRATQYKRRLRRRSTYDELISTGTIGFIRDQALRDTATRLYSVSTIEDIAREGRDSKYREAFRMALPNDVQRTLGKQCGDRYITAVDYAAIVGVLDYTCSTAMTAPAIGDAVKALRSNLNLVSLLRLRIADIETRLVDLTSHNRDIMVKLRVLAKEK